MPIRGLVVGGLLLSSGWALAAGGHASGAADAYVGFAEVIRADPVVTRALERVPVKRCAWEYAPVRRRYDDRYEPARSRRIQRCRTTHESRVSETTAGYDVTLRYNGETFTRRTNSHPGARMPIKIEVIALED